MKQANYKKASRINVTLDNEFYDLIKHRADQDYMKAGSWLRRFLKQNLLTNDKIK